MSADGVVKRLGSPDEEQHALLLFLSDSGNGGRARSVLFWRKLLAASSAGPKGWIPAAVLTGNGAPQARARARALSLWRPTAISSKGSERELRDRPPATVSR